MAIDYSPIAQGSILCAPTDSVLLVLTVGPGRGPHAGRRAVQFAQHGIDRALRQDG